MAVSIHRPRALLAKSAALILASCLAPMVAGSACESMRPCMSAAGDDGAQRFAWEIHFQPGTAELDAEARSGLDALLACLRSLGLEGAELRVQGFAHRSESDGKVVQALAHDRADAIAWRLRQAGSRQVTLRGFEAPAELELETAARAEILVGFEGESGLSPACAP